jgi:hypothetical protein
MGRLVLISAQHSPPSGGIEEHAGERGSGTMLRARSCNGKIPVRSYPFSQHCNFHKRAPVLRGPVAATREWLSVAEHCDDARHAMLISRHPAQPDRSRPTEKNITVKAASALGEPIRARSRAGRGVLGDRTPTCLERPSEGVEDRLEGQGSAPEQGGSLSIGAGPSAVSLSISPEGPLYRCAGRS